MKKTSRLVLLTLALVLIVGLVPGVSNGAAPEVKGPACSDINGAQFSYLGTGELRDQPPYTFAAQLLLGPDQLADPCRNITYTLYIVTDPGAEPIVLTNVGSATFGPIAVEDDDPDICVSATTDRGGRILDTAPDSGCLALHAGATGGQTGFS